MPLEVSYWPPKKFHIDPLQTVATAQSPAFSEVGLHWADDQTWDDLGVFFLESDKGAKKCMERCALMSALRATVYRCSYKSGYGGQNDPASGRALMFFIQLLI